MKKYLAVIIASILVIAGVEMLAARPLMVSSNVVYRATLTGLRISSVNGTALIDNAGATVPTLADGNHLIEIYDSAGLALKGYLKAAGDGEDLGAEINTGTLTEGGSYYVTAEAEAEVFPTSRTGQSVTLTGDASGSTGITVTDDDNIDFGTGNFTLVWKGSLPDWTPNDALQRLIGKYQDLSNRYQFGIDAATPGGRFNYLHRKTGGTDVTIVSSLANSFVDGTVHEIVAVITRETESVAGSVSFYVDGYLFETVVIPAGTPANLDNTGNLHVSGNSVAADYRVASTNHFAATYNRALAAAEVLDLYSNGIDEADKWGSQTEQTSGTLVVGRKYRINNWITDDDFTNVGGANVDGTEFTATGTTPTKWTNSSTVVRIGATFALESEKIRPATWYDTSTNNLDGAYPAAGTTLDIDRYVTSLGTEVCDANNKVQQVTGPSTSGCTIVSAKGGETYNFAYKNASFTYNAASYYVIVKKVR